MSVIFNTSHLMKFYENIAGFYDDMTRFSNRIEKEQPVFQNLIKQHNIKTALDVACGTGLHTILLNELGVKTTGVDISSEMLKIAERHANNRGQNPTFLKLSMLELSHNINEKFDAVFCLGNSLPHLQDMNALNNAIAQFAGVLQKGGIVFLQILNYAKILETKNRIVNINYSDNKEFIRFYDFLENKIRFNLLMIKKENDQITHTLNSTILVPYLAEDITKTLKSNNLIKINVFENLLSQPFQQHTSNNLVLTAIKS